MNGLERAFERMGARVEFGQLNKTSRFSARVASEHLTLDVRRDQHGEYFLISRALESTTELIALDVQPRDRHLLLLSRRGAEKHRFLLGHDERHWFVAGIPETTPVSRVRDAKQALKPDRVQSSERGVRAKYRRPPQQRGAHSTRRVVFHTGARRGSGEASRSAQRAHCAWRWKAPCVRGALSFRRGNGLCEPGRATRLDERAISNSFG